MAKYIINVLKIVTLEYLLVVSVLLDLSLLAFLKLTLVVVQDDPLMFPQVECGILV